MQHTRALITKVSDTIKSQRLINEGHTVIIAVSGGADSVALLYVLLQLSRNLSFVPIVAHINHGLRGKESDDDEKFVAALARKYHIRYVSRRVKVSQYARRTGMSLEAAARELRYQSLISIAKKYDAPVIAVAHHAEDLAETMIMHFLRGSGKTGLGGFAIQNRIGKVRVVRPFYTVRREEILAFLKEHNLSYRVDSSNVDERFLRNRIRHELIPVLIERYNPNLIETLQRTSEILQAEDEYLEKITGDVLQSLEKDMEAPPRIIPVDFIDKLPVAVLRRLIRQWIERLGDAAYPPTMAEIEAIIALCRSDMPGKYNIVQNRVIFYRDYKFLMGIAPADKRVRGRLSASFIERHIVDAMLKDYSEMGYTLIPVPRDFYYKIALETLKGLDRSRYYNKDGVRIIIQNQRPKKGDAVLFTISLPLPEHPENIEFRTARGGDILVRHSGSKPLNRYFIDEKIPLLLRKHILLVCCGKKVMWIPGTGRFKEPYSHTKKAQKVYITIQKEPLERHGT